MHPDPGSGCGFLHSPEETSIGLFKKLPVLVWRNDGPILHSVIARELDPIHVLADGCEIVGVEFNDEVGDLSNKRMGELRIDVHIYKELLESSQKRPYINHQS